MKWRQTGLVNPFLPEIEALHVVARVDVVAARPGDVARDDVDVGQRDREVTDLSLLQVFFEVGKDRHVFFAGGGFLEVLAGLQHAAGNVGMSAAAPGAANHFRYRHRDQPGVDQAVENGDDQDQRGDKNRVNAEDDSVRAALSSPLRIASQDFIKKNPAFAG